MAAKLTTLSPRVGTLGLRTPSPPKTAEPFYQSREWKALVARLVAERGRRCEACGATGQRLIGDHVVERKDGGAELDPANIRLLCLPCHNRKTAQARAERLAAPVGPRPGGVARGPGQG